MTEEVLFTRGEIKDDWVLFNESIKSFSQRSERKQSRTVLSVSGSKLSS